MRYIPLLVCFFVTACGADANAPKGGANAGAPNFDDQKGSAGSPGSGLPTRPARQIYLTPADVSTAVQPSALELWVDGEQGDLGDAQLQALSAAISLASWPELGAVAFKITATDASKAGDMRAHVSIAPVNQLERRWYAVLVKPLPTGFQWWNAPGSRDERVARFRTDSMPVIASVTRCDKGNAEKLIVRFSETVLSAEAQKVSVDGASCEPVVEGAQELDAVDLICATGAGTADLTLTFGQASTLHANKDAWVEVGEGCFEFVPKQLTP